MKSLEQFRAEQLARLEKETAAHAKMLARAEMIVSAGLPIPEYIADGNLYGAVTLTYRNSTKGYARENLRSMSEAVSLFRQFADNGLVMPFHVLRASCVVMHPESCMSDCLKREGYKRDSHNAAGYAVKLYVTHRVEGFNTSAHLEFFARFGGKLWRISIEFGQDYIGQCSRLAPRVERETNFRNETIARNIYANADAHSLSDSFLSYAYGGDIGPKKSGANHVFLFSSDYDDDTPSECSHALAQLESLAAIVDGVQK